jgi:hypothetical protein
VIVETRVVPAGFRVAQEVETLHGYVAES